MTEREEIQTYYSGVAEGICKYAHWKDGVQYVGTTGKTLKEALEDLKAERKYQLAGAFN
jgi:hypothetical protein